MKVLKSFLPDKNLDKKVEQLTDGYEEFGEEQKILDFLSKFDLNRGILYVGLDPLRFEQCNLPYEKVIYLHSDLPLKRIEVKWRNRRGV